MREPGPSRPIAFLVYALLSGWRLNASDVSAGFQKKIVHPLRDFLSI